MMSRVRSVPQPEGVAYGWYWTRQPDAVRLAVTRIAEKDPIRTVSFPGDSATRYPDRRSRFATYASAASGSARTSRTGYFGRKVIPRNAPPAAIGPKKNTKKSSNFGTAKIKRAAVTPAATTNARISDRIDIHSGSERGRSV